MSRARQEELARARQMFEAGQSAQDVSKALNIGLRTAFTWRDKLGIVAPNAGRRFAEARKKPAPLPQAELPLVARPEDELESVDLRALVEAYVALASASGQTRAAVRADVQQLLEGPGSDQWVVERLRGGIAILVGPSPTPSEPTRP